MKESSHSRPIDEGQTLDKFLWQTDLAEMIADEDDGNFGCNFDVGY